MVRTQISLSSTWPRSVACKCLRVTSAHHTASRQKTRPPLLSLFVLSEGKKVELMKAKKILKTKNKKVYIDEDLTPLRAKMFYTLRKDPSVSAAWTVDGRLHCKATVSGKEMKVVIDSPDDLFHLGYSEEQMKPFYV